MSETIPNLANDVQQAVNDVPAVLTQAAQDIQIAETFWSKVSPDIMHHVTTLATLASTVALAASHHNVPALLQYLTAGSFGRSAGVVYNKK